MSEVLYYDFETDSVISPFRDAMERNDVQTPTEGLFELLPTDHLIVEEENAGRLLLFSPDGHLLASFVNNNEEGEGFRMGWSRYITEDLGARALAGSTDQECPAAR